MIMKASINNLLSLSTLLIICLLSFWFFINWYVLKGHFYVLNPFSSPEFILFLVYIVTILLLAVHIYLVLRYKSEYTSLQLTSVSINIVSVVLIFIALFLLGVICMIDQWSYDCRLSTQIIWFFGLIAFLFVHVFSFIFFLSGKKKKQNLNKL